jgi:hypothetical protein
MPRKTKIDKALDNGPAGPETFATAEEPTPMATDLPRIVMPASSRPPVIDIPGFSSLPADVQERMRLAYRDPTAPDANRAPRPVASVQVKAPGADDIFRTHPDQAIGWYPITMIAIKKNKGGGVGDKTRRILGPRALENRAVAERAYPAKAVLWVNAEGILGVWLLRVPDMVDGEESYKYDFNKWQCAEKAATDWCTCWWDRKANTHKWHTVDLSDRPNSNNPAWTDEHPVALIDRAIAPEIINDPAFREFDLLLVRKAAD